AGKYYISFSYNSPHQTTPIQVLDSIEINADSIILSNFITHGDTTVCFGDSSIFSTINLGSRYRYQWQIDNSTIVGADTNFIYAKQQGSYKLTITDTLINCTRSSNPINFTVKPRVNLKISLLNNDYCAFLPNAISYRDSSSLSSGTYTRLWHFGDGSTTNLLSGNKVYDATGDYIVKLVVNTNSGCKDSIISTVTVTKPPKPVITVSSNTEFCQGKSIVLSSNTYPNATYFWYKNNTRISLNNSTNITVNEQANYKVIISSGFNCNDTSNIISTLVYPAPKVGFTVNNLVQCLKGNNFNLSDTSTITSGQLSRVWSWQNNANNQPNIDITINSPGTEQIKLIVTSNNGCKDSAMKNLTVLPSPSIGSIAGPSSNLLTNQQYSYNINQQLNHTYNWHVTNGNVVNGQGTNAISAQWLSQGTGFVKAIISNTDACNDSAVLMVSIGINAPIITSFTPQTGSNGTQITINGSNLDGASVVLFGGVNAKNFNVVSSSVITATVDTGATGNVSVVTPNGTALLTGFTYINNTGITEYLTQSYTIFPNPVSSEIIIESDKTLNNSRFELMDLNGKVLINTTCNTSTNRLNIDVKTLSPAIYLLRITSHGQTSTVKVVKQ
ncbi:MAG: PKD domain-containing protein, partial [Bacteroidia bacterium]